MTTRSGERGLLMCLLATLVVPMPVRAADVAKLSAAPGVWQSRGYGQVLDITPQRIVTYDVTLASCVRASELQFPNAEGGYERVAGSKNELSFYSAGGITRYVFDRLAGLPAICTKGDATPAADPLLNFDVLSRSLRENYAFFGLRGIDWDGVESRLRPRAAHAQNERELFGVLSEALASLHDGHVVLAGDGRRFASGNPGELRESWLRSQGLAPADWERQAPRYTAAVRTYVEGLLQGKATSGAGGLLTWGWLRPGIGYLNVSSMYVAAESPGPRATAAEQLALIDAAMPTVIATFARAGSMIVDARFNGGGYDAMAMRIAGYFADQPRNVLEKKAVWGDGFTEPQTFVVQPRGKAQFVRPVYVLQSGNTASAAEIFVLAMKSLPHVTRIGTATHGVLSDTLGKRLPVGWDLTLSNELYTAADGRVYESIGVPPDVSIGTPAESFEQRLQQDIDVALGVQASVAAARQVEIRWDRHGIPHIFGRTADDVFYGLGYAQMQNHAEQLLVNVAAARGRYSEYFGAGEKDANVTADVLVHTQGIPRRSLEWLCSGGARQRRMVRAFVEGVNAYAARHGDTITPAIRKVLPFEETDPFSLWQWTVQFTFMKEGPERHVARWLREQPPQALNGGGHTARAPESPTAIWDERRFAAGSNGWALAPSHTASGNAILMGNPHLDFGANGLTSALQGTKAGQWQWMEAHLVVGDPGHPQVSLSGVGFVGVPAITIGFNDFLGWTHTVNGAASSNAYELALQGGSYRWGRELRRLQSRQHSVRVCGTAARCETRKFVVESSVHGPIVARKGDRALALRVAGLDASAPFEQYWDMGRARSYREFEAAFSRLQMPYFNVVYADRDGHILFADAGRIPRRAGGSFSEAGEILKGEDPAQLWSQYLPWEALPRALDPPSGFLQNGNDSPWTSTFPAVLRRGDFPSYVSFDMMWPRSRAGARFLVSQPKFSFDEIVQGKLSTRMMVADLVLEELLRAAAERNDESLSRAAAVLHAWDRTSDHDSRGSVLFERWWRQYEERMAVKRAAENVDDPAWSRQYDPAKPLDTPSGLADTGVAVDTLKAVVAEIQEAYGRLDVPWGEVHRVVLVSRDSEYLNPKAVADVPANGASDSVGVIAKMNYPPAETEGRRIAAGGEGYMQVVEFTPNGVRALKRLTYGNASRPGSKHVTDQLQAYVDKQLLPALRTREEILRETEQVEVLQRPPAPP